MERYVLAEVSICMSKAIKELLKTVILLEDDAGSFEGHVSQLNNQIAEMSRAVEYFNSELREVV